MFKPMANRHNPYSSPVVAIENDSLPGEALPSLPIELTGDVSVANYMTAWRLANWTTVGLWIRYASRCLVAGLGLMFLLAAWGSYESEDLSNAKWQLFMAAVMFGCLVLIFVTIRHNVQRHLVAMDSRLGDSPLVCDAQGVHIQGGAIAMDYKWEGFEGYRSNGSAMVLYVTYPRMYLGLFAEHTASPKHWQALQALVSQELNSM